MEKVNILILFAAILAAAAVATKSLKGPVLKGFPTQKLLQSSVDIKEKVTESSSIESENVNELNTRTFRLPNNTIPLHYNIYLRTNVHRNYFDFDGTTMIKIRVQEPSNTITLHSFQMLVYSVNLFDSRENAVERNLIFATDNELQFLVITTSQQLLVDQELTIEVIHSGSLRTDRRGFYRSSYTDRETNQNFWVTMTYFEPTHARHAFPCYDEIRFRTTFDIQIMHHQSYRAVSNMPVEGTTTNGDYVTTKFNKTPPMPTHKVAFSVSNFDFISNNNEDLPMKIYAPPNAIAAGQANISLELGEKMLQTIEQFFEIPFVLPKSDMIAVDIFDENVGSWGLIKIADRVLLAAGEPDSRDQERRLQIAYQYLVRLS